MGLRSSRGMKITLIVTPAQTRSTPVQKKLDSRSSAFEKD
jgi:hypothetical protein